MSIRAFSPAAFVLLTCGVAWAATTGDPPSADQVDRFLDLMERGGPAVNLLLVVLGIAFLASLTTVVLVLTNLVRAAPRIARPLADAYATLRGGATVREERLRAENAALLRELDLIKTQLVGLEHRDEEKSRIILALVNQLASAGMDVSALRAMATPRPLADEVERASAAA
ncbi:hypothetical protein MCW82_07005 [Azospirillum doebereinerae]|uniref:hypothetical protein n=1 Tax=Azospirillum doebereinerae TaxID=92933 RepID=UPI001EE58C3C|nr:hypothetical protein [Azospirillum doebereinerae]MCG5239516.1 hypothetical protein [Azospirillum doebereinerae]